MNKKTQISEEQKKRNENIQYFQGKPNRMEVMNFIINILEEKYVPEIKESIPTELGEILKEVLDKRDKVLHSYMNHIYAAVITIMSAVLVSKGIVSKEEIMQYVQDIAEKTPRKGDADDGEKSKEQGE